MIPGKNFTVDHCKGKKGGNNKRKFFGFFCFFIFKLEVFIYIARFGYLCQAPKTQYTSPFFPLFLSSFLFFFSLGAQINGGGDRKSFPSERRGFFFVSFLNCREAHLS